MKKAKYDTKLQRRAATSLGFIVSVKQIKNDLTELGDSFIIMSAFKVFTRKHYLCDITKLWVVEQNNEKLLKMVTRAADKDKLFT